VALKDILVVLDASERSSACLAIASSLALRHGAGLIGLCPHRLLGAPEPAPEPPHVYPAPLGLQGIADIATASAIPEPASQSTLYSAPELAERIGSAFRESLAAHSLRGTFETEIGPPAAAIVRHARTADLVVLGQPDPDDPLAPLARRTIEDVLLTSGRPALLVPYAGHFATVGTNVVIGWTETREAARAAHDALPLIATGAKTTLLAVHRGPLTPPGTELPTSAAARHFARHGIDARPAETIAESLGAPSYIVRPQLNTADALLNYASDTAADLLVVGAYAHSRAREVVLGGVTHALLATMTLPVLMSH
jgi:nucleotide-binding universal stress UspA family protein